jgi:hypothetical protein
MFDGSKSEGQERTEVNGTPEDGKCASNVDNAKISSEIRCKEYLAHRFIMALRVSFG